jgi:hypothetical protein
LKVETRETTDSTFDRGRHGGHRVPARRPGRHERSRADEPQTLLLGPGQSQGPVNAAANDLIYHGGSAGPNAIGVQVKPAV